MDNRKVHFFKPYDWEGLRKIFSYSKPGYRFAPSFRRGLWDGRIRMLKYDKVPTGLFLAMKDHVESALGLKFSVEKALRRVEFSSLPLRTDRDYQVDAVVSMQLAAQTGGGLVLGATGTGKTMISGLLLKSLRGSGVFVVDELTLLKQTRDAFAEILKEEIGQIGNSIWNPQRITVATIQTLHKHRDRVEFRKWAKDLKILIVDELHVQLNRRNFATVAALEPDAVFGLTATLQMKKAEVRVPSWALAGPVCFEYTLKEATQDGYLTKGFVVQVQVTQNDTEYRQDGDRKRWKDDRISSYSKWIVNSERRNKLIAHVARLAVSQGRRVVVLVEWVKHLKTLSELLKEVKHEVVYGDVKVEDRVRIKKAFEDDDIRLLLANKVFKKGVDIKAVDFIIDAAALSSGNDPVQKYGRGVRLMEGKKGLVYVDIGDIGNRFELAGNRRRRALKNVSLKVYRIPCDGHSIQEIDEVVKRAVVLSSSTT